MEKLTYIKKQMELLKYSIENDSISKLKPLTVYYFLQATEAASSISNEEILDAINSWYEIALNNVKNKNIDTLSTNVDMVIHWINILIQEEKLPR